MNESIYQFKAHDIEKKEIDMSSFRGKVLLIVNVASKCGFTPQYKELEELYQLYKEQGLVVLGFPCDQFGHQEPGDEAEIKNFCQLSYDVSFPLFAKIEVNGTNAHPLFRYLKGEKKGILGTEMIKWNFTKFLVDREGYVVERFAPKDKPLELKDKIKKFL
jgi:glutathione peroxidase